MVRFLRSLVVDIIPQAELPILQPKVNSLELREENADLLLISQIRELSEFKRQQFKNRFDKGNRCFIALKDGSPATYLWIRGHGEIYYSSLTKVKYPVAEGTCWYFDAYTSPQFRGLGILPWLYRESRNAMGRHLHYFADVALDNKSSIRSLEKVGFRKVKFERTLLIRNRVFRLS